MQKKKNSETIEIIIIALDITENKVNALYMFILKYTSNISFKEQ